MNEDRLVSVIIPVYNCSVYLEKCLHSVLSQSYQNIEVIVVNDGSTDDSGEVIKKYADAYANILMIEQCNLGVSAARNKGIEMAGGEYLLFLDGDDYIGKDYVRSLVQAARANDSDLVICGCTLVDPEGKVIRKLIPEGYEKGKREEWAYHLSSAWSRLYRKKVWTDSEMKFATGVRGEDIPIALFFNYTCSNIVVIPECEYYYVQHQDSAMGTARGLESFQLPLKAIREVLERTCNVKESNSRAFFAYGVIKALAMFLFDLGRGASWQVVKWICQETEDMILQYFPEYKTNRKCRWNAQKNMPLAVKGGVWLLVQLMRFHMLRPFMWIYCRLT